MARRTSTLPAPAPRLPSESDVPGRPRSAHGSALDGFTAFIRHFPGAWWIKDAACRYVYVNAATAAILGVPGGDAIGKTDFDLLPKEAAEALRAHDEQVLRTGENLQVVEHVPDAEGGIRSWFSAKFMVPLGGERCTAGFAIELTPFIRENRAAQEMIPQILDAISDMVLVKGPHSRLEWANKAFLRTYGMTNEQLKGLIDAPFTEPDITQQYVKDDLYVFNTGLTLEIPDEPMSRHDGAVLTCHTVKSPIFDDHGKVIKSVAVIRDITERKRLELELRQAQKLESVGRLASGVAHEINTPIQFVSDEATFLRGALGDVTGILQKYRELIAKFELGTASAEDIAGVRRAEEDGDLDYVIEHVPSSLDAILDGTARVSNLVRAMKEFGHPDRGEKCATDLNRALRNTVTISANETKYVADVRMDLGVVPEVPCYPNELSQVFLNLIVNAAHAIGEGVAGTSNRGEITITTRHVGPNVIVTIGDTGPGIPEHVRTKIFEPFFTTKAVGRGTGQGLAIARLIIVEKHRGTLTFDTQMGVGTVFRIGIPVDPAP